MKECDLKNEKEFTNAGVAIQEIHMLKETVDTQSYLVVTTVATNVRYPKLMLSVNY